MSLIAISRWPISRRSAVAAIGVGVAASLTVATVLNPKFAHAVDEQVSQGIGSLKTVAAMLAERSPGQRPEGALANLKHKRQAALHERALPKIRGPISPIYEALAGPPTPVIVPPVETPLFNALGAGPPVEVPPPGTPGGPPILGNIPPPGGGGGGFFSPPVVTTATPEVPATPVTPVAAVPEPASWAMMILGFALIGRTLRRRPIAGTSPALA